MSGAIRIGPAGAEDDDRFARFRLVGWRDRGRLAGARVLVVGAGALGNETLEDLALLGAGRVFVADRDRVENSNRLRPILFRERDRGRPRAEVAAGRAAEVYPAVRIRSSIGIVVYDLGQGAYRWADVILGGRDNREARVAINQAAARAGKVWIGGAIERIDGVARVFDPATGPRYEFQAEVTPPERYQLEYRIRSSRQTADDLAMVKSHLVEIALPMNDPWMAPQCRMLTPIFHPNIAPHAICIGDHRSPGEPLWSIVARIGERIALSERQHQEPAQRRGGAVGRAAHRRAAAGPDQHDARRPRGPGLDRGEAVACVSAGRAPAAAGRGRSPVDLPALRGRRAVAGGAGRRTVEVPPLPERVPLPDMSETMPSDRPGSIADASASWDAPEWPADEDRGASGPGIALPHPDADRVAGVGARRAEPPGAEAGAPGGSPDRPQPSAEGGATPGVSQSRRHRDVLALSVAVLILALVLVEVPGGRVAVRGLTGHPLPPSCATRSLLGIRCPGCGLTRSFIHLVEGDWRASWRCHRLGGLMAAVVVFQIPYRMRALRWPDRPPIPPRWQAAFGLALIALLVANWLADVVTGRLASL